MSKTELRRRVVASLTCLVMLLHLLGMSLLANASAPAKRALGIGGHCQQLAERAPQASLRLSYFDHALLSDYLAVSGKGAPAHRTGDSGSNPCCCASSCMIGWALGSAVPSLPVASKQPGIVAQASPRALPRSVRTAINPRAPPFRSTLS